MRFARITEKSLNRGTSGVGRRPELSIPTAGQKDFGLWDETVTSIVAQLHKSYFSLAFDFFHFIINIAAVFQATLP